MPEEVLAVLTRARPSVGRVRRRDVNWSDRTFYWVLQVMGWSMIALVFGIFLLLLKLSIPALQEFGLEFFITNDWNPPLDSYGALPFIYGTLLTSLMALLMATPVSIGVAVFLTELAPRRVSRAIGFLVEMLAAIPSVVYGLWGIFILAPLMQSEIQPYLINWLGPDTFFAVAISRLLTALAYPVVLISNVLGFSDVSLSDLSDAMGVIGNQLFSGPPYGVGMLTAGIVLAIMITPTIAAISREVFQTVNPSIKEAALALGATRWETIRIAVLKTGKSGVLGATILGLGRALGETMAVTMVIGNRNDITAALMAPGQTMASVIANEYPEAADIHMASLAAVGLSLFAVSIVINSAARLIIWRVERGMKS